MERKVEYSVDKTRMTTFLEAKLKKSNRPTNIDK